MGSHPTQQGPRKTGALGHGGRQTHTNAKAQRECHLQVKEHPSLPEARRDAKSPSRPWEGTKPAGTSILGLLASRTVTRSISVVEAPPCPRLLGQPQETNTAALKIMEQLLYLLTSQVC